MGILLQVTEEGEQGQEASEQERQLQRPLEDRCEEAEPQ